MNNSADYEQVHGLLGKGSSFQPDILLFANVLKEWKFANVGSLDLPHKRNRITEMFAQKDPICC